MSSSDRPSPRRLPSSKQFKFRKPDLRLTVVWFDPGRKRTGVAQYEPMSSIITRSMGPWEAVAYLETIITTVDVVGIENWVSYPQATAGNAWDELLEVRTIGALEWVCSQVGKRPVFQTTGILTPTRAIAKARGYQWIGNNRDEIAAETHLYYYQHLRKDTP